MKKAIVFNKSDLVKADVKELLSQITKRLSEVYSNKTWLRVLVQQLPHIGSTIDTILTDTASKNWQKKVEKFLYLLTVKLSTLEEKFLDKKYVKTDEFIELLRQGVEASGKVYEQEKLEYFANILKNSVIKENSDYYFKENFIKIVNEVSALHILVLKFIYDKQKNNPPGKEEEIKTPVSNNDLSNEPIFSGYPRHLLETYATELIRYGLLYDWSVGRYDYTSGRYRITQYARDFIKFIVS